MRGASGRCDFARGAVTGADLLPIPPPAELAEAVATTEGMERLYRRFARVLPLRFAGVREASLAEHGIKAVEAWFRQGPAGLNVSAQLEGLGQ